MMAFSKLSQAATIQVPAGGDLQQAIDSAKLGDIIIVQAGAVYQSPAGYVLPYKGTGTGTDADYITIQTSNLAGIAAPNTRISPAAHSSAMPRLMSTAGFPVISTATGAHHYKLIGLEVTTNGDPAKYVSDLIYVGPNIDNPTRQQVLGMRNFIVDRCFIHTAEIDASNLFTSTINRTSGRGVGIKAVDVWVQNSYIAGFAGQYPTVHPEAGHNIDSYGVYSVTGPGPIHILNNYIEAQFNNIFLGGGDPDTPNTATISNATLGSATFSNVNNLQVGDLVAFASTGATPKPWQSGRVTAINGTNVSFTLLRSDSASPNQVPDTPGLARWRGDLIRDVEIRGNFLNKPDVWNSFSDPKAWIEVKIGDRITIDGNDMYSGVGTTMAFTVRNQNGAAPWATISNLTFTNNRVRGYKWAFGIQTSDNEQPSGAISNFTLNNNLFYKPLPIPSSQPFFLQLIGGITSGVRNVTVLHNTILQPGAMWITESAPITNFVFKDNLTGSGGYGPTCYIGSGSIQECWPSVVSDHNLIWDNRYDPVSSPFIPGTNYYQTNVNAIGFVDLPGNDYRLSSSSPYRNGASDGKDVGVDIDALSAALGGASQSPTPTPTPTPGGVPSSVTFVQKDSVTKGNWKSAYGADGYNTINDAVNYPAYAQVSASGQTPYTWNASTSDSRALLKAASSDGIAAAFYSNSSLAVDVNLTDGAVHRLALYCLDWDVNLRNQRIDILDVATGGLLDSRGVSAFDGGIYLVWDIKGHVKINVVNTSGSNAVISGLYFGGPLGGAPTPTPIPTPTPTPDPNSAPSVSITSPANGSTIASGSNLTIAANASDSDGSVVRVEFFQNGVLLGSDTSSPYSFTWTSVPVGSYNLTARSFDNLGSATVSATVSLAVKKSPASVGKAIGHASTLLGTASSSLSFPSGGDAESNLTATEQLVSDLGLLQEYIQTAYNDFLVEQATFGATTPRIDTQLQAALYFCRADLGLATKLGPTQSVWNHLRRVIAHLAMTEDLMLYGGIFGATLDEARAAQARVDLVITNPALGYGAGAPAVVAPGGLVTANRGVSPMPFSSQAMFANLSTAASVAPFELAGVNVTVGGISAPLIYAAPDRVAFQLPVAVPVGVVEVIVTSQEGYLARGSVTVAKSVSRIMTSSDDGSGAAIAINASTGQSGPFDIDTSDNFGSDKRTRVAFFATGISGSVANTDTSNDLIVNGLNRPNYAESVIVEARTTSGLSVRLPVEFAGTQGVVAGIDQVSVVLPSSLKSTGRVQLTLILNGQVSNAATIDIR